MDETGHRSSGPERGDNGDEVRSLAQQFVPAEDIPACTQHAGTPVGDELRPCALLAQSIEHSGGDRIERLVGDVSGPHHRRPQQAVERDIAVPGVSGGPGQHQDDVEPQTSACGGGQAGVIALAGPAGDQRVRATSQGGSAEPLQLAHLVAATSEPGEVIAFHPEIGGAESERTRQSRRGLEGSGPAPEGSWRHFSEFRFHRRAGRPA